MLIKYLVLCAFSAHFVAPTSNWNETHKYNILSLNSATYKGTITAEFIDFMERRAYKISLDKQCIQPRESERVSVVELYDMVAGVETGAILASTLVIKNDNKTST